MILPKAGHLTGKNWQISRMDDAGHQGIFSFAFRSSPGRYSHEGDSQPDGFIALVHDHTGYRSREKACRLNESS
jgi:hypothetical protein